MKAASRDEPLYPLEGTRFDLLTEAVAAMPPKERFRFIRDFLKALSVEIVSDTMRLLSRVPFKDEMRDLHRLCRTPTGDYLRFDDARGRRDVLMFGAPGRSHVEHTAHVSWRIQTNDGDLETQIRRADKKLVEHINRFLVAKNMRLVRGKRPRFIPCLFANLKMQYALSSAFLPFHARLLAERYLPESGDHIVVDPCAGWGGRLLGVLCAKREGAITYIGTDPQRRNQKAYKVLEQRVTTHLSPRDVKGKRSAKVYPKAFEDWMETDTARRLHGCVSLVITSPPYYAQEKYEPESNEQSAARYKTYPEWRKNFLHPLIQGAARLLKPGGVFALNIADVAQKGRVYRLEKNSIDHATRAAGFVLEDTLKLAMPVRPGGQKLALRHEIRVADNRWTFEPVFVFRKRSEGMETATTPVAPSGQAEAFAKDYPDFDELQAQHAERVRRRAEKALRGVIHREYLRLLGRALASLKGTPLPNPSARMRAAHRRVGLMPDEVYGGVLDLDAAMCISNAADAERWLTASCEARADGAVPDSGAELSIFTALDALHIGASTIAAKVLEADTSVRKSARLRMAEEAAERVSAESTEHVKDDQFQRLSELGSVRNRRRRLRPGGQQA
jgi:tRNA1(Val) A37 N6-methylase TrmN6